MPRHRLFVTGPLAIIILFVTSSVLADEASADAAAPLEMVVEVDGVLRLTSAGASHFAALALICIDKEYPNKLNQSLPSIGLLKSPSELHPAFFGCYDWHSSVHGHWMLVKLLKEFPDLPEREEIIAAITTTITVPHISTELRYFDSESATWERTYGWAWLLQLAMELETWDDPLGEELADILSPLSNYMRRRFEDFMPRQDYPIRTGVHPNTAFGLTFALDYATALGKTEFREEMASAAMRHYAGDENCPIGWEPGGEDFLSPCLEEAALMSRVLAGNVYRTWLRAFLPQLYDVLLLEPAVVSDRSDGQIGHLDGLNLSRAWNLYQIADAMGDDAAAARLRRLAAEHLKATLPHVASEHYEGTHWLGSFAVYALTR